MPGWASTAPPWSTSRCLAPKARAALAKSAASLALTGLVAFSSLPLRLVAALGLLISLASLSYGVWVVIEYFIFGNRVPGYATVVAGMMLLSGIQLLSMGVLAEYVGRIYEEVKQRPTYLLKGRHGRGLGGHSASGGQPPGTGSTGSTPSCCGRLASGLHSRGRPQGRAGSA